ncbi:CHAP domain-containing protein [Streptomyces laculatispora]|nr:CHAP domain-containing protein [Streptomyces laculatispora]
MPKGSYPVTASCATATSWWKQQGRWSDYPAVGAQVMFGPGGGSHTGIVIAYDATTITTIEGNTNTSGSAEGDGVYRKVRQRRDAYVYGYGYPAYPAYPGGIKSADSGWMNPTTTPSEEGDMADPIDVLRYRNAKADAAEVKKSGKHIPDVYGYIVQTHAATVANTAAIKTLAKLAGADVDTAAVVAAVEAAIKDAVITVDINTPGV